MKKTILRKIAPLIVGVGLLAGCSTIGGALNDKNLVLTSPEYVAAGDEMVTVKVDDLPEALTKNLPEGLQNEEFVVVDKDTLEGEDIPYLPLVSGAEAWGAALDDPDVTAGAFDTVMALLIGFFPSLAAWEGMLIVLFRRKRQHWVNFVKHLLPFGNGDKGDVNVSEAVKDALKAMGTVHSSDTTQLVYEEERAAELEDEE